jgi:hypothetical protein
MGQASSVPEKTEKRKQGATRSDDRSPDATQNPQNQETQQARDRGDDGIRAALDALSELKHEMIEERNRARHAGMASGHDTGQSPAFGVYNHKQLGDKNEVQNVQNVERDNRHERMDSRKGRSPGRKSTQVKGNGGKEENHNDGTVTNEGVVQKRPTRPRSQQGRKPTAKPEGGAEPKTDSVDYFKELSHDFFTDRLKESFDWLGWEMSATIHMIASFVFHLVFMILISRLIYDKFLEGPPDKEGQKWHAPETIGMLTTVSFSITAGLRFSLRNSKEVLQKFLKSALKLCLHVGFLIVFYHMAAFYLVPGEGAKPLGANHSSNQKVPPNGKVVTGAHETKQPHQQAELTLVLIGNLLQSELMTNNGFVLSLFCDISYNLSGKSFDTRVRSVCEALDLGAIATQLVTSFGKTSRVMLRLLTSSKLSEMINTHIRFENIGGGVTNGMKIKLTGFSIGAFYSQDFTVVINTQTLDPFVKVIRLISYLNLDENQSKLQVNLQHLKKIGNWKAATPQGIAYEILRKMFPNIKMDQNLVDSILNGDAIKSTAGGDENLEGIIAQMNKPDAVVTNAYNKRTYHDNNIALVENLGTNLGTNWGKIHKNKKTRSTI